MIDITDLIKHTEDFDSSVYTQHLRSKALTEAGHHETPQGWFDRRGQFLGKTPELAINRLGIQYEQVKATLFYALNEDEVEAVITAEDFVGVVAEFRGVHIWGRPDE